MPGVWISQGDADYWAALGDCRNNPSHFDRGKDGRPGEQGGDGAVVVFRVKPSKLELLDVTVDGGEGGPGGRGGSGRLLKNGRNHYCDGCTMNCPSGDSGRKGPRGSRGEKIILTNQ